MEYLDCTMGNAQEGGSDVRHEIRGLRSRSLKGQLRDVLRQSVYVSLPQASSKLDVEEAKPVIEGLFETHIHVSNLEASAKFYEEVLGLELAHVDPRKVRFYWIGGRGKAMLGIWEKDPSKIVRQHFAFQTSIENMRAIVPYLKERGLSVHNFLKDGTERPFVFGWMPAVSIYFRDPDGHSLEFISMLPDEPKPELGVVLWEEWEELHGRAF